jgi:hypothetical protein
MRQGRKGFVFPPEEMRSLMLETLPEQPIGHGEPLTHGFLYVPTAHVRALHPDSMLVVGIRGAGKSAWWAALQDTEHRKWVAQAMASAPLDEDTLVSAGFGPKTNQPEDYPGPRTLHMLLDRYSPHVIWYSVIAWHATDKDQGLLGRSKTWEERIGWVEAHPEQVERALSEVDHRLAHRGRKHLILFDALDRTSSQWKQLRALLRGLLQAVLDFRSFRAIRAKAFVRPDMLEDPEVSNFPDASKVLASRVSLDWPRADLFGLLWQHLGNGAKHGAMFRELCEEKFEVAWKKVSGVWPVPKDLRRDEELQRSVFHSLTGPYMGRGMRRGAPYTWLPNHLADAHLLVSPRNFLFAIRTAALSDSNDGRPFALFHESIKQGVQAASRIRVKEIGEDHPWIDVAMQSLRELVIPCDFSEIKKRWKQEEVVEQLDALSDDRPKRIDQGSQGLKQDLIEIGVFEQMSDGRINMPDVYRVGFGLKRKGGIPPIR